MTTNTPTLEPWALDALRELIDIAGLLNDEMFLSLGPDDGVNEPRLAIIARLQALTEAIALASGEPEIELDLDEPDEGPSGEPVYFTRREFEDNQPA